MARNKNTYIHLAFWFLNISITFLLWQLPWYSVKPFALFLTNTLMSYVTSAVYFYFNYLFISDFLIKKKYLRFFSLLVINIVLNYFANAYVWNDFVIIPGFFRPDQISGVIFSIISYGSTSIGLKLLDHWEQSEAEKILLEKELNETELLFLQSQMSPHFLFNTLNNIYGLSLKNAPETSIAIKNLKELMLYFQQFEKGGKIKLNDELENLKAFIALHKMRNNVEVEFNILGFKNFSNLELAPMLLLPPIENAFKHGDIKKPIIITLNLSQNYLEFSISNQTNTSKRKDAVGGIGINNLIRRLELLYPKKHAITFENNNYTFELKLCLDLT